MAAAERLERESAQRRRQRSADKEAAAARLHALEAARVAAAIARADGVRAGGGQKQAQARLAAIKAKAELAARKTSTPGGFWCELLLDEQQRRGLLTPR